MDTSAKAVEILRATNDGDNLEPAHLKLVEGAVNGFLTKEGMSAFDRLYAQVEAGYKKPWFHGIEHLTIDSTGCVYWKGQEVEHYNLRWAYSGEAAAEARELARRCSILEERGEKISPSTVIWKWEEKGDT